MCGCEGVFPVVGINAYILLHSVLCLYGLNRLTLGCDPTAHE